MNNQKVHEGGLFEFVKIKTENKSLTNEKKLGTQVLNFDLGQKIN